jgi:O-antigen/teichoic acid export membrane protein
MGIVIRQSVQGTIVNYFGAVLGAILVLFVYPLCLTPEMIGLTRLMTEAAVLFSFIAQAGMPSAMIRYFPSFRDEKTGHHHFFFWTMTIPFAGFVLVSIAAILFKTPILNYFATNSPLFNQYYFLLFPLAFAWLYISATEVLTSVSLRIVFPKFSKEILVRLLFAVVIVLFYFHIINFQLFIIGFVAIYLINALVNFVYVCGFFPVRLVPHPQYPDKETALKIGRYMGYVVLMGLGGTLVTKIDTFMIGSMIGLAATGIYSIAFFMVAFIEIPSRSVIQISTPLIAQHFKDNDISAISKLYKQITNNQIIISGIILLLLWINMDNIYAIMPKGEIYSAGKWVVLLIGITKFIDVTTGINAYILAYSKYYKHSLWLIGLLSIFTVTSNLLLIPHYGIVGAAFGALISFSIYNVVVVLLVWKKIGIQPFSKNNIIGITILLIVLILQYTIPTFHNPFVDAAIRSSLVVSVFAILLLWLKPSIEIQSVINLALKIVKEKTQQLFKIK